MSENALSVGSDEAESATNEVVRRLDYIHDRLANSAMRLRTMTEIHFGQEPTVAEESGPEKALVESDPGSVIRTKIRLSRLEKIEQEIEHCVGRLEGL